MQLFLIYFCLTYAYSKSPLPDDLFSNRLKIITTQICQNQTFTYIYTEKTLYIKVEIYIDWGASQF